MKVIVRPLKYPHRIWDDKLDCEIHLFATALTHDDIDYMKSRGSPVYLCSLDAEGAFDGIPHSILFRKALGVIPDMYWRILVYWKADLLYKLNGEVKLIEE